MLDLGCLRGREIPEVVQGGPPKGVELTAELRQSLGVDFINAPRALGSVADQSHQLEQLQMLADRRSAHRQLIGELGH